MWKTAAVVLLATLAIGWHLRYNQGFVKVPELKSEYWGPGKPVADPKDIKPFKINVPKEVIEDLHRRLDLLRFMTEPLEGVAWTYGISSTYLNKTILSYWRNTYDWIKRQELLNKYSQFMTKIQGLDIHFYHVKPQLPKNRKVRVLPLLLVHGWPGSVVEFQKIIPLLTTARPDNDFVFELVIPSLPGYGFSKPSVRPGLGAAQIGLIFKNLMSRLGFERFYTQGSDWGSKITTAMAGVFPKNVIGAHLNTCFVHSPKALLLTLLGAYLPFFSVDTEHQSRMYPLSEKYSFLFEETGYFHFHATRSDTVGVLLYDSPVGLAAYILEKFSTGTNPVYKHRDDGGLLEKYTLDELLDNVMIYWVTNSIITSLRLYSESFASTYRGSGYDNRLPVEVPTACAMFPHDLIYQSETILRERYRNMIQLTHPPRGGHYAAMEEPELLADDIWSFVSKNEQIREADAIKTANKKA